MQATGCAQRFLFPDAGPGRECVVATPALDAVPSPDVAASLPSVPAAAALTMAGGADSEDCLECKLVGSGAMFSLSGYFFYLSRSPRFSSSSTLNKYLRQNGNIPEIF